MTLKAINGLEGKGIAGADGTFAFRQQGFYRRQDNQANKLSGNRRAGAEERERAVDGEVAGRTVLHAAMG